MRTAEISAEEPWPHLLANAAANCPCDTTRAAARASGVEERTTHGGAAAQARRLLMRTWA